MKEPESQNDAEHANLLRPLNRSMLAVCCILGCCMLVAGISALLFLYQVQMRDAFGGEYFHNQPGAWPHLMGHVLRFAIGAGLAWCLWRYLLAVHRMTPDQGDFHVLFRSLERWWYLLAISVVLLAAYALWVTFFTGPLGQARPPERHNLFDELDH
jgi:hypothetical protein